MRLLKTNLLMVLFMVSASTTATNAFAMEFSSGNVMNCQLEGGGLVQLNVDDGKTSFVFDSKAKAQLQPASDAMTKNISGSATLADIEASQGYGHYYELLEVEGSAGQKVCQTWVRFQVTPGHAKESVQGFAHDGTIALATEKNYNYVSCPDHKVKIESCKAGLDLKNLTDLREFYTTEIPD